MHPWKAVLMAGCWAGIILLGVPRANSEESKTDPTGLEAVKPIEYSEVVDMPGASAADLYLRAQTWFSATFNDSNHVLKVQDKEAGLLLGAGRFTMVNTLAGSPVPMHVTFSLKVMAKDGRYRYELTDLFSVTEAGTAYLGLLTTSPHPEPDPAEVGGRWEKASMRQRQNLWDQAKPKAIAAAETLIASLKKGMTEPAAPAADDSW